MGTPVSHHQVENVEVHVSALQIAQVRVEGCPCSSLREIKQRDDCKWCHTL